MGKTSYILLSVMLVTIFVALGNPTVNAQNSPAIVEVEVLLVDISNVNLAEGSYGLDFFLAFYFSPAEISMEDVKDFFFLNSAVWIGGPIQIDEIIEDEEKGIYSVRVSGLFTSDFDFTQFPFETHSIELLLENKSLNASYISYQAGPRSRMLDSINVGGWEIGSFDVSVTEKEYIEDVFSQFKFSVNLNRPVVSNIVKIFFPIIVFSILAILAFLISPENAGERLTAIGLLLVTVTAFYLAIVSGIPATSYLTFFDEFIIVMYLIFLYIFAESAIVKFFEERKEPGRAKKLEKRALKILPIIFVIIVIIFVLLI